MHGRRLDGNQLTVQVRSFTPATLFVKLTVVDSGQKTRHRPIGGMSEKVMRRRHGAARIAAAMVAVDETTIAVVTLAAPADARLVLVVTIGAAEAKRVVVQHPQVRVDHLAVMTATRLPRSRAAAAGIAMSRVL